MANAIYPTYKQALMTAADANLDLDQAAANIAPYVLLINTGSYIFDAAHDFFNDLSGIVGPASGMQITSPTVNAAGTFDGADVVFTAVSGVTVEALVIYRQNAGANSTWHLVMYYDTAGGGLPVIPNGGDITVQWNASGIFTL